MSVKNVAWNYCLSAFFSSNNMEISFGSLNNITSKCHLKWLHKLSLIFFSKTALYELLLFLLYVAFKDECCGLINFFFTKFLFCFFKRQ